MKVIARFLCVLGLLVTVVGNAVSFYASSVAVYGIQHSESTGIAAVAWGVSSAHFWGLIGLIGCVMLMFGFILSITKRSSAG